MPNFISEDQIEQALLQRLQHQPENDALNYYTAAPEEINNQRIRKMWCLAIGSDAWQWD